MFKAFAALVFFVYYETWLLPGSLHSYLLLLGGGLVSLSILYRLALGGWKADRELLLIGGLCVVLVLGFLLSGGYATVSNLQAYALSFLTFVFVRESASEKTVRWVLGLIVIFAAVNAVLTISQFAWGGPFPSRLIATFDNPRSLPSGVSDGATKNGMLLAMALAVTGGRLLFSRASKMDFAYLSILLLGTIALIVSTSRAGLAAWTITLITMLLLPAFSTMRPSVNVRALSTLLVLTAAVALAVLGVGLARLVTETVGTDGLAARVVLYKLAGSLDSSMLERVENARASLSMLIGEPFRLLSIGMGPGAFESRYGLNVHNSYLELLVQFGVVGTILFFCLVFRVVASAWRSADPALLAPALLMLVSIAAFMAFHDVLRGRVFWLPLGILSALAAPRKRQDCE